MNSRFLRYFLVGLVLVIVGAVLPFLMVLNVIESTFFLNFFAYGAQILGVLLGVVAAALYFQEHRGKN